MLRQLIKERKREELVLTNGITLEVRAPTLRGVRGSTCVAVICDEIAFLRSEESVNPDAEILRYVRLWDFQRRHIDLKRNGPRSVSTPEAV
jgi:hypothetical protein